MEGLGFYICRPPGNEKPVSGFKNPCGIRRFVKQCADVVTESNVCDGAAIAIERYVLGREEVFFRNMR